MKVNTEGAFANAKIAIQTTNFPSPAGKKKSKLLVSSQTDIQINSTLDKLRKSMQAGYATEAKQTNRLFGVELSQNSL